MSQTADQQPRHGSWKRSRALAALGFAIGSAVSAVFADEWGFDRSRCVAMAIVFGVLGVAIWWWPSKAAGTDVRVSTPDERTTAEHRLSMAAETLRHGRARLDEIGTPDDQAAAARLWSRAEGEIWTLSDYFGHGQHHHPDVVPALERLRELAREMGDLVSRAEHR